MTPDDSCWQWVCMSLVVWVPIFGFISCVMVFPLFLFRWLASCDGRRDSFPWSWSILIHQPWWMCSYDLSAVWSHPLFDSRLLLYERKGPRFMLLQIYTLILCAVITYDFSQQWLNEEKLAQRLIELIHPERDDEVDGHFFPRIFI